MRQLYTLLVAALLLLCFSGSVYAVSPEDVAGQQRAIEVLKQEIAASDAEVNKTQQQIDDLSAQIAQTAQALAAAQEEDIALQARFGERARAAYMYGDTGYLDYLFSAQSPSGFISFFDITKSIMKADKREIEAIRQKKQEAAALQESLSAQRTELIGAKKQAEATRKQKEDLLAHNQALAQQLQIELARQNEIQKTAEAPQMQVSPQQEAGVLAESSTAPEAVAAATSAGAAAVISGSSWVWPVDAGANNAFLITSLMGTRESPGGIGSTDHGGTDIGAGYGSAVLAASGGTVVLSGGYGGYGNAVMIDHGNGLRTLYGHLSSIAVHEGEQVQPGQIIGTVGSTGWSTGPHLHFEVRSGEDKINGLSLYGSDVLGKLSYSTDA